LDIPHSIKDAGVDDEQFFANLEKRLRFSRASAAKTQAELQPESCELRRE
jgi:hypothetical protein